jgi:hypothetical protein
MNNQSNSGKRIVIWIAVLGVVLLIALYFLTLSVKDKVSTGQANNPIDIALRAELGRMLGPDVQLLGTFDVGADSVPDYIGILLLPQSISSGGTYYVKALAVSGMVGKAMRKPGQLLQLLPAGILNSDGTPLLAQVKAEHGYRVSFRAESGKKSILLVTLLDENAQPASDELGIGWDAASGKFAVLGQ